MTSETLTAEPFLSGLFFGECPRWHDGRLWYSDFFDHAVLLGVARGRAPGRGGLRRRAGRAGLAARRPPPDQLPPRPRRHAPRAGRDASCGTATSRPGRRGTPTTWWWPPNGQAYAGNFGFDLDGLFDGTLEPSAIAPGVARAGGPRRHQHRGGGGHPIPQRHRHHRRRRDAHRRRDLRRLPHRVRPRGRRHPDQPARVGRADRRRARRHLPVRRRVGLGGQRAGGRVRAGGRGRRGPRARGHGPELLRLHARRRGPADPLPDHRAGQPRRPRPGRPATAPSRRCGRPCRAPASPEDGAQPASPAWSARRAGCARPGRCAARSR